MNIPIANKYATLAGYAQNTVKSEAGILQKEVSQLDEVQRDVSQAIWFKGVGCELSNLYMHEKCKGKCEVRVFGKIFISAEHAYKWKCADYHNDDARKFQIERTQNPWSAMRIGDEIKTGEAWQEDKEDIMKQCLIAKFIGCDGYRQFVLSTKIKHYREDTKHPYWGGEIRVFEQVGYGARVYSRQPTEVRPGKAKHKQTSYH